MSATKRILITVVGIGLALTMSLPSASADGGSPSSLTAEWWQWVLSIPPAQNPVLDATGANCVVGQRGGTWFLAGTTGGPAVRNCTVPEGRTLFFPVANYVFVDTPDLCGQGPGATPVRVMRAAVDEVIDDVTGISVQLDDEPVRRVQRIRSQVFAVAMPEDNYFDAPCASAGGSPGGVYPTAVDDGYYVTLRPLAPGVHTLHFHAEAPSFGVVIDTTYNLTVVPVPKQVPMGTAALP